MSNITYKDAHINFVTGHTGTSIFEIALVVSSAPLSVFIRNEISWIVSSRIWLKLLLDFICLVIPGLCCFTLLSEYSKPTLSTLALFAVLLVLLRRYKCTKKGIKEKNTLTRLWNTPVTGKRPFISSFRANVNLATAICILAVDFSIFPRRFSKAETYGTGLMDVGVGAFVISNAIVWGKYLHKKSVTSKVIRIARSLQSSSPLWILGFARILAVKTTDYQEHVSEYGVHWNFFFTLGCVKILSTIVFSFVTPHLSWLLAIVFGLGYQYLLDGPMNLKTFVLYGSDGSGTRKGIVNANREGLASCLGYLSIFFAGIQFGKFIFKPRKTFGDWFKALFIIITWDMLFWICLMYCQEYVEPVSRRLANLSYIIWMLGYNFHMVASFLLVDLLDVALEGSEWKQGTKGKPSTRICLLEAINYNGLLYFLLSNVLTGCVNICIDTIHVSHVKSFIILICYMFLLSIFIATMYVKQIQCKFW